MSPFSVAYMCMCLGMSTWDWINYQVLSLEKSESSPSFHSLLILFHLAEGSCEVFPINHCSQLQLVKTQRTTEQGMPTMIDIFTT